MAENNSSAPLKTAEEAAHQLLIALRTIAEYPATDSLMNMDAANMRRIAAQAVAAQAAPAAVAVTDAQIDAILDEPGGMIFYVSDQRQKQHLFARRVLALATPALPATEDSSAGDLAEVPDGFGSAEHWKEKAQYWAGVAHELRGQALRGEPVDGIIQPTSQAEVQAEPVAKLSVHMSEFDAGEIRKAASISMIWKSVNELPLGDYQLYTAPQAQPADAAIAEKAAKYDRLVPYLCKTCSGFGLVGGHCQDGSFDSQPCPDCNQPTHTLTQAVLDVLAERARQIEDKGYEPEADDVYEDAQLAAAAATYALLATGADGWRVDDHWPWTQDSLKKGEARRMLEKAGALILAEMERLDRAAMAAAQEGGNAAKEA